MTPYAASVPLYWRLVLGCAVTLIVGVVLLAATPFEISYPPTGEQLSILALGVLAAIVIDAALIGTALAPLVDLKEAIEEMDSPDETAPLPVRGNDEVAAVTEAYNEMLVRLGAERVRTVRAALRSQEDERARIARELHDEVGQTMTFLLLRLQLKTEQLPTELREEFEAITDAARAALDEVRTISRRLRPAALADLGIAAALESVIEDARHLTGIPIELDVAAGLGRDTDRDLVLFRVTQEAMTNIVKHAGASQASVQLTHDQDRVVLTISDDGVGTCGTEGTGTYSMRERARLVGGDFERVSTPGRGTRLVVRIPLVVSGADEGPDISTPPTRPLPTVTVFPPPEWLS